MREFTKAFGLLAACQREALLLAVLEGWSYQRIAVQSDVSVGTVKSRISRARTALRLMLTGEESVVDGAAWSEDHVREVGDSAFAAAAAS